MKIVAILTTLGVGGAEKQVVDLAERIAARGHSVSLLVLKHSEEEWPTKLPVMRLNLSKTPMGLWRGLRFATSFLSVIQPEILHSHTFPANIFARVLGLFLRRRGMQTILINTIHNVYEGGWHRMLLYRATDHLVDAVTAVSRAAAERYVSARAVPLGKMTLLTNGIDVDHFSSDTQTRRRARAELQAGIYFIWIAIGRLVPAKDYPNLLRAFAQLREHEPRTELWIVGEGDAGAESELSASIAKAGPGIASLGLRRDIRELLDAADAFVLSSAWEGMPLALGEAMSMGKPVVATDVGGVRELVGDAGILVPAKDSSALSAAMLQVMAMSDRARIQMGHHAAERIRSRFSIDKRVDAWEALYAERLLRSLE